MDANPATAIFSDILPNGLSEGILMGSLPRWLPVLLVLVWASSVAAADATIFAAASLKEALDEQSRQFEASSGKKVVISYGASNALAKQIEAGAPADLFISADLDWMDY